MKKDIVEFASTCSNYQQVKVAHQRLGGLAQNIELPEWKWEMIKMDYGLHNRFAKITKAT